MRDDYVERYEILYRAIKRSRPSWLEYGRPTSAMFRDDNGVSVDRDGGRHEIEVIDQMKSYFKNRLKGVVRVEASDCFDIGACVDPDPNDTNPYHANIWLNLKDRKREMLQAYYIAQHAEVVYINEIIEWST